MVINYETHQHTFHVLGLQCTGVSKISILQVVVCLVMALCTRNDVIGYQNFGGSCCLSRHPEDRDSMASRNNGILPHQYTT